MPTPAPSQQSAGTWQADIGGYLAQVDTAHASNKLVLKAGGRLTYRYQPSGAISASSASSLTTLILTATSDISFADGKCPRPLGKMTWTETVGESDATAPAGISLDASGISFDSAGQTPANKIAWPTDSCLEFQSD